MSTSMQKTIRGIVAAILVLTTSGCRHPVPEDQFKVTQQVLDTMKPVIYAEIRRETGVDLEKKNVPIEIATRDEMEKVAEGSRDLLAQYVSQEKRILVCPENLEITARRMREPGYLSKRLLGAVLIHEGIHAADDILFGFPGIEGRLKTAEADWVFHAIKEGHAQYLARKISERAGWKDGFNFFTRMLGGIQELTGEDAISRMIRRIQSVDWASPYYDGERFIAVVQLEGGAKEIERAFREPPSDREVLCHPEWFLDPDSRPAVLDGVEIAWDPVRRAFAEMQWGHQMLEGLPPLQIVLAKLPDESAERILKNSKWHRTILLTPGENPSMLAIGEMHQFTSPAESAFYLAATRNLSMLKSDPSASGSIREIRNPSWSGIHVRETFQMGDQKINLQRLVAIHESVVLDINLFGKVCRRKDLETMASQTLEKSKEYLISGK